MGRRILLIQSYLGGNEPPALPLGLVVLAARLPNDEVRLLDLNTESEPFEKLEQTIGGFRPEIVGISLRNIDSTNKRKVTFYYEYLKPTLKLIRRQDIDVKIILGGAGFSMFAEQIMQDALEVDFGVYREGEEILPELLENLNRPEQVKGLYFRSGSEVHFTGIRELPELVGVPAPRWDLVDVTRYAHVFNGVGIETKRGCSLGCIYCPYPFLNGRRYRFKAPTQVVDEIEELHKTYGVQQFSFIDSVFNVPLWHAEKICRELVQRNLKVRWSAWLNESAFTRDFLLSAKSAGCDNFIFSPDGFSDATLRKLGKNIKKDDILRVARIFEESGSVRISYNFFKNPPGQTFSAALQMLLFLFRSKLRLGWKKVSFEINSLRIEPHTGLYRIALGEKSIGPGEELLYPVSYSNPKTRYLDRAFDLLLLMKGK